MNWNDQQFNMSMEILSRVRAFLINEGEALYLEARVLIAISFNGKFIHPSIVFSDSSKIFFKTIFFADRFL